MPIRDRHIAWKSKRKFFGVDSMNMIGAAGADAGAGAGAPIVAAAAGGSLLAVVQMAAAGDSVALAFPIPHDLRRDAKVLGRVVFIHSSTDADTPDWLVTSKAVARLATVVSPLTGGDKAIAFPAKACSVTDESLETTDWKDLEWDQFLSDTDLLMTMVVECNGLGSASANEIELLGFELMYEVEATQRTAANINSELSVNPL